MPTPPLAFWLVFIVWVAATLVFISQLDKQKLAVLVILLSLLMIALLSYVRRVPPPSNLPVHPASAPQFSAPM